jgi:hypothetical protein
MRTKSTGGMLATGGLVLLLGAPAAAQLEKQGTYSAAYGWTLSSTVHEVEDGHVFTHDVYKGTIFNDAGKGFLHEASNVCFGVSDLIQGKGDAHGYCVVTDKTNDKAFLVWKGTIDPATGFQGTYQWTGGTGQYTGLKGNNTFQATRIGSSSEGRALQKGEWQLP